jgi:hypothetical protein
MTYWGPEKGCFLAYHTHWLWRDTIFLSSHVSWVITIQLTPQPANFNPEDPGNMFLKNVGIMLVLWYYIVSHSLGNMMFWNIGICLQDCTVFGIECFLPYKPQNVNLFLLHLYFQIWFLNVLFFLTLLFKRVLYTVNIAYILWHVKLG